MKVHFSSKTDLWSTPQDFYEELNKEFNFILDPCATEENAKCPVWYDKKDDGLSKPWYGSVFMNPPYGREIGKWVEKAFVEARSGRARVVVGLLPARTDTRWWHDYIQGKAEVRFIKGRLKFGGSKNSAPFPSVVVVWNNH